MANLFPFGMSARSSDHQWLAAMLFNELQIHLSPEYTIVEVSKKQR